MAFHSIYSELKTIPKNKFEVHFAYITSPNQLALFIKNIAETKKIDILIIGGHGNPDSIFLEGEARIGRVRRTYCIDKSTLKSKLFDGIDQCFSLNAVCYLASCSTGGHQGSIADEISKRFKIKTYAPIIDTTFKISVKRDGNLEFMYEYGSPNMFYNN